MRRAWLVLLLTAVGGCTEGVFACSTDAQCLDGSVAGICHEPGFCAFPDEGCGTDYRFGSHAGGGLAGVCIPDSTGTGTAATGTTTGSGTSSSDTQTATSVTSAVATQGSSSTTEVTSGTSMDTTSSSSTATTATTGEPSDEGLVVWYQFEDPLDDGPEDSGPYGLDGQCMECPSSVAGVQGNAALFTGSQVVQIPSPDGGDLSAGATVAFWVRVDAFPDSYSMMSGKPLQPFALDSFEIFAFQTDGFQFLGVGITPEGENTVYDALGFPTDRGQWIHLAMVWDTQTATVYVDADPYLTVMASSIELDDSPVLIGADMDAGELVNYLSGAVDDYRIYLRPLDPGEVEQLAGL